MKIVIVGIGKLGSYLTRQLVDDSNEITVVDLDFSNKSVIINNLDINSYIKSLSFYNINIKCDNNVDASIQYIITMMNNRIQYYSNVNEKKYTKKMQ